MASFFFPADPEYLVISARETWTCEEVQTQSRTFRVFGDGHVEIDPAPSWLQAEEAVLEYVTLEDLLHSLDVFLGFAAHRAADPVSGPGSLIEVHLESYSSADREQVIDDLHVLATEELDTAFAELGVVEEWLILRAADGPIWVDRNPWPRICEPEYRRELGLSILEPVWCSPPYFEKPETGPFSSDDRETVLERLRERLRTLPRGLRETVSDCESENGVDLRPVPRRREQVINHDC